VEKKDEAEFDCARNSEVIFVSDQTFSKTEVFVSLLIVSITQSSWLERRILP
jgi:hypothetical protein